jgi:hypothetical protein
MAISRPRYKRKKKRYQTNRTGSKSKFERGYYVPKNPDKYKQPQDKYMNSEIYPEYRSSWEKQVMKYLDLNPEVEYWASEPFAVHYLSPKDGQIHRYFPDFLVKFKDGRKYILEVKPKYLVEDIVVQAKAEAAKEFCKKYDMEFHFITEEQINVQI